MKQMLGIVAVAVFMFSVAMPAKAELEDYRIMPGSQIEVIIAEVFAPVQAVLAVGAVVQVNVDSDGNVVSMKLPEAVLAIKDLHVNIAKSGSPIDAVINIWNDPGTWDAGSINLGKAQGFFLSSPNTSPVSGHDTTWQNYDSSLTSNFMYNNMGGFLAVQGGFGGPLALRGGGFSAGAVVAWSGFGQNATEFQLHSGWRVTTPVQGLPWVTGTAYVRNRDYYSNWYHWSARASSYPSGYPYPSYVTQTRNGARTLMGAAAVYNASGASRVARTTTKVIHANPYVHTGMHTTNRGRVTTYEINKASFSSTVGKKALGPETVSVSLVMPAILNPGVVLDTSGSIQLKLQKIISRGKPPCTPSRFNRVRPSCREWRGWR